MFLWWRVLHNTVQTSQVALPRSSRPMKPSLLAISSATPISRTMTPQAAAFAAVPAENLIAAA